jgi:hypothetical protein
VRAATTSFTFFARQESIDRSLHFRERILRRAHRFNSDPFQLFVGSEKMLDFTQKMGRRAPEDTGATGPKNALFWSLMVSVLRPEPKVTVMAPWILSRLCVPGLMLTVSSPLPKLTATGMPAAVFSMLPMSLPPPVLTVMLLGRDQHDQLRCRTDAEGRFVMPDLSFGSQVGSLWRTVWPRRVHVWRKQLGLPHYRLAHATLPMKGN